MWQVVTTEINSAPDNPLIFTDSGNLIEGGNFHGQPVALAADYLGIALAELANISERRTERVVNGTLSGLPRFLTSWGGLHSDLTIAQYAVLSLVSENTVLAHPASGDSILTSANQEDHNNMDCISAQGEPDRPQRGTCRGHRTHDCYAGAGIPPSRGFRHQDGSRACHDSRGHSPDRYRPLPARDIMLATWLVSEDTVFRAVEDAVGTLE